MAEKLAKMFCMALDHWQEIITIFSIIVSLNIFLIGALKTFIFNKLANSLLRKAVCFTSSLVLLAGLTTIYFWVRELNFEYFIYMFAVLCPLEIVVYAGYENWGIRNLVDWIAKNTLLKVCPILVDGLKTSSKDKTALAEAIQGVEKETKTKIVTEIDSDLNKLLK